MSSRWNTIKIITPRPASKVAGIWGASLFNWLIKMEKLELNCAIDSDDSIMISDATGLCIGLVSIVISDSTTEDYYTVCLDVHDAELLRDKLNEYLLSKS